MHSIFCDQYNIKASSLGFDDYVEMLYRKEMMNIVQIHPVDWIVVLVLVFGNWIRDAQNWNLQHCDPNAGETALEYCSAERSTKLFTIIGKC